MSVMCWQMQGRHFYKLSQLNKAKLYMFLFVLPSDRKILFGDTYTLQVTQTHSFRFCECEQNIFERQYIFQKGESKDSPDHTC